jgi:hypothetical protein
VSLPLYHLSSERVALEWITSVAGGVPVGTGLPAVDDWTSTGYITLGVLAGDPNLYTSERNVIVDCTVWVGSSTSQAIPWAKASHIAEGVFLAALSSEAGPLEFAEEGEFHRVLIGSVYPVSTPRRRPVALTAPDDTFGQVGFELGFYYAEG